MTNQKINVLELFAGVGGFRIGLENSNPDVFKTLWANQWEPSRKSQDAFEVYDYQFPNSENLNENISEISDERFAEMDANLIVGGFPCIMEGELVLTEDGYRPIEDIEVGDYVYTHTGGLRKVLRTMSRNVSEYYELKSRGNHGFGVTGEHPIYLNKDGSFSWVDMKDISVGDLVGLPKITKTRKITHPKDIAWDGIDVKVNGEHTRRVNHLTPDVLSDYNFWWMVGYFIGNGWVSEVNTRRKRNGKYVPRFVQKVILSCGKDDTDELESKLNELDYFTFTKAIEKTGVKFICSSKELSAFMLQFGKGASYKSLTKTVLDLPNEYLEMFLQGYSDSDGHTTVTGSRRITTTSSQLAYDVSYIVGLLYGKPATISKVKTPDKTIIEGREVNQRDYYIVDYFKEVNRGIGYHETDDHVWTKVTNIDAIVGDIRVYNIEVDVDNSYIVQNVIVHNCQDYSVARSTKGELGVQGKKGVLFWDIIRAVENINPEYLILENVDRLLKSPTKQRGRDFAVMLSAFNNLGYSVEWRVINAAEYGFAQRRRRVFFFVYRNDTPWGKAIGIKYGKNVTKDKYEEYLFEDGLFAQEFEVKSELYKNREEQGVLSTDIVAISDNFVGQFWNTGIMRNGEYYTVETIPLGNEQPTTLGDIYEGSQVDEKYYINDQDRLDKFKYLRGPKRIPRVSKDGHEYIYSEGGISPYDSLDMPARTMLTSEGSVNRSTHLLKVGKRYRLLTPVEAERIQDFPDDWTRYKRTESGDVVEVPDNRRTFFMGNALVTGVVKRIADRLQMII